MINLTKIGNGQELAIINGKSVGEVWEEYVRYVWSGKDGHDEDVIIKEKFWVTLVFEEGTDYTQFHSAMDENIHPIYLHKMLETSKSVLGDSYGYRIKLSYGINQEDYIAERIAKKPESKAIFANLLHPITSDMEREMGMLMEKTACLAHLQYLIRDDTLHLTATFRSQNVWKSHGNFVAINQWNDQILEKLAKEKHILLKKGRLVVQIAAAHLYESDWHQVLELLEGT